jgi:hypothetical protein
MQANYKKSLEDKLHWLELEGYYLWYDGEEEEWELNKERITKGVSRPDEENWYRLFGRNKFSVIEQGFYVLSGANP